MLGIYLQGEVVMIPRTFRVLGVIKVKSAKKTNFWVLGVIAVIPAQNVFEYLVYSHTSYQCYSHTSSRWYNPCIGYPVHDFVGILRAFHNQ